MRILRGLVVLILLSAIPLVAQSKNTPAGGSALDDEAVRGGTASYETGNVLKWETHTYSQSAHIIRDHPGDWIRIGNITYQIARRSREVEMQSGQLVECRVDKGHVFVRTAKGRETKYDILGME